MTTEPATIAPSTILSRPPGNRRRHTSKIWLTVLAIVVSLATIFPLLWMVSASFKPASEVTNGSLLPHHFTIQNFVYVFTQVPFVRFMVNSFIVSAVVTVVALLFHSMAAYALARLRFPGREVLFVIIFSTLLVTFPVVLVPLFLVARQLGLLDSYAGLIIPAIFNAFGIFLLRQFYLSLPTELEEAAIVDGCGYWRIYWSVVLPLSKPIMAALSVFFFLANWNSFIWPLIVTSNQNLTTVQLGISSFQTQYSDNWNYVLAASTIAAIPTLALFFAFQRRIIESIKTTGLK